MACLLMMSSWLRLSRRIPLRWHLVLLVVGTLLPVVAFATIVVLRLASHERAVLERNLTRSARALAADVDREMSTTIRTLQALSESEHLDGDDLADFHAEAQRVVSTQPSWRAVLLLSPEGQILVHSREPWGKALPRVTDVESLKLTLETRQPVVGNLVRGPQQRWAFAVRVPVIRGDSLRYVLTAVITTDALVDTIARELPAHEEWTRTIVDSKGVVTARTRDPERFVGQLGTPPFLQHIRAVREAVYRDTTMDGVAVYVAFSHALSSNWTAAIAVPVDVMQGPSRRSMLLVIAVGLALLFVSGAGAFFLSRRVARGIADAADAAEALAHGAQPRVAPSLVMEVARLGESLERSSELLSRRERERDEHLARAEAARAEAEMANRAKDEFLGVVSHELRTPLNAVLGWAQILRQNQRVNDAAFAKKGLEVIERNARAQAKLVDDILDVSRIVSGKLRIELRPMDLASAVRAAIEVICPVAEARGVMLRMSIEEDVPVSGDPDRLQQVVWNLLSNAVSFTPKGGSVEVLLERGSQGARLVVRDSGRGIEPAFLPYVFERFRQADSSATRRHGGLGLGLAIVRDLVELHGGRVFAESEGLDKGAAFTVELPLRAPTLELRSSAVPRPQQESEPMATVAPRRLDRLKILVVDDDPDARELLATMLGGEGAEVVAAASAAEAFDIVSHLEPHVIVSDIGMPLEDGCAFLRRLRASGAPCAQTPALALTAYAGPSDVERALHAGFQAHLPKPVEPEALVPLVTSLAGRCPQAH